jgi:hypothetical protein
MSDKVKLPIKLIRRSTPTTGAGIYLDTKVESPSKGETPQMHAADRVEFIQKRLIDSALGVTPQNLPSSPIQVPRTRHLSSPVPELSTSASSANTSFLASPYAGPQNRFPRSSFPYSPNSPTLSASPGTSSWRRRTMTPATLLYPSSSPTYNFLPTNVSTPVSSPLRDSFQPPTEPFTPPSFARKESSYDYRKPFGTLNIDAQTKPR